MPDPKLPTAKRRLNALLRDEDYGPKLVRLNRADERYVLDLVYEGRGREARQAIDDLDERRRLKRTLGGKARAYARLASPVRSQMWHTAMSDAKDHESQFWALYRSAVLAA